MVLPNVFPLHNMDYHPNLYFLIICRLDSEPKPSILDCAVDCLFLFFSPIRSFGGGNVNPVQYYCLENPMDGEACWATVHGAAKSRTQLNTRAHTHTHTAILQFRMPISVLIVLEYVMM